MTVLAGQSVAWACAQAGASSAATASVTQLTPGGRSVLARGIDRGCNDGVRLVVKCISTLLAGMRRVIPWYCPEEIVRENLDSDNQSLRGFLRLVEAEYPDELLRVRQPIDLRFDATSLVFELDHAGKSPVVMFENVRGNGMQLVTNVAGNRKLLAACLGVEPGESADGVSRTLPKVHSLRSRRAAAPGKRSCSKATRSTSRNCRSRCSSRSMRRRTSPPVRSWRAIR